MPVNFEHEHGNRTRLAPGQGVVGHTVCLACASIVDPDHTFSGATFSVALDPRQRRPHFIDLLELPNTRYSI